MLLMKFALLATMNGSYLPYIKANFHPLPWFDIDQKVQVNANPAKGERLADIKMSMGAHAAGLELRLGNDTKFTGSLNLHHSLYAEVSYSQEF